MAEVTMSQRALNRALLARQLLLRREPTTALRATSALVGLQAQVAQPPFIGLWTRLESFTPEQLRSQLRARKLVRVTMMRSTLHLMRATDYVALRPGIQPALESAMRSALRKRLDGVELDPIVAAARECLSGAPMTFARLREQLAARFPEADPRMMGYAVRNLIPLVQVPDDSPWGFPASADSCLASEWLGAEPSAEPGLSPDPNPDPNSDPNPDPNPDPSTLVRRYLAAFGPATPADAQVWSGLSGLRAVFDQLRPKLRRVRDERGRELFDLPRAPRPDPDVDAPARLIPAFDNLVLSHADRTRIIADEHRKAIVSKNLQVSATFLIDGFVAGTWKLERSKQAATVALSAFIELDKRQRAALTDEAEALLRFAEPDAPRHAVKFSAR
ncbi:winged helix DNA-binding domain-containing protein [Enhygromyxa salina]|uniref:Winged helix DNA-binding domain-containing protein n=1 Tax=Enhygromyxa salina TaxID=215803 RepID=A0A2S9YV59_9BACT|nr:winged helix DNA-binding domain-containing protein [Enhygromyxa salina]PRQ08929.1 hypothetical protein ENSA7_13280 [Enhygromyxa salina]